MDRASHALPEFEYSNGSLSSTFTARLPVAGTGAAGRATEQADDAAEGRRAGQAEGGRAERTRSPDPLCRSS